ncbi:MAG: fibronectin type III domain-containing protein [Candidatus Cloacimonetes bacterium]|nr:fibronectin type III domain-containing protein [Candidatus Cloacimonadota bacterium]
MSTSAALILKKRHHVWLALFLLAMLISLSSCGLKRSNPLDPIGNSSVVIPDAVQSPSATASSAHATVKSVTLRWTPNAAANTSGYYVYRGLGYFSSYTLVGTVNDAENNSFIHSGPTVLPGYYYFYRISAFKYYPGAGNLEGARAEVAPVIIPD